MHLRSQGPPNRTLQPRDVYAELDNGVIFDLDSIRDPDPNQPLKIPAADYSKAFAPVLRARHEPNLDANIKAIVLADHFVNGTAILLTNDFVVAVNVGEFNMGHVFYLPSPELRRYKEMTIAS